MDIANRTSDELWVCHLGIVAYADAIAIQEHVRAARQARELPDTLLLLEHPPTYTRGRRATAQELPFPESFYEAKGIELHSTDRGGRVTYHAPGQLVGYPIMAITDVHRHLRKIEHAIIDALAQFDVHARSRHDEGIDYTGVWVATPADASERKIASIGVHVSRGVSTHGFAVNVDNDVQPFSWVVACGLPDVQMTSIAAEARGSDPRHADYDSAARGRGSAARGRGSAARGSDSAAPGSRIACFRREVAYRFCQAHGRRQRLVTPTRLGIATTVNAAGLAAERAPTKNPQRAPAQAVSA